MHRGMHTPMHQASQLFSEPAPPERVQVDKNNAVQAKLPEILSCQQSVQSKEQEKRTSRPSLMENGQLKADLNSTLQSQIPDDDDEVGIAGKITA